MTENKLPPRPISYNNWGQWAIDDIFVRVNSDTSATIYYEKYEKNALQHYKNIKLWLWEKGKFTLEDKVNRVMNDLINKLKYENILIVERQELSKKLSHRYK